MRVIACSLKNFASYKYLDFSFEKQGLTLIQGATGSGKSTLCDAIPWLLFGRTAKDGAVDEVISWNTAGPTVGTAYVDVNGKYLAIKRSRNPNDLCYFESEYGEARRGKDLNDTQKLINNILGIDCALYLSGAYFHEFSQTAQFFTTTAKNRRAICEQLVDLSLAKKLQFKLTEYRKELYISEQMYVSKIQLYADRIQQLNRPNDYQNKHDNFEQDNAAKIAYLTDKINSLEIKPDSYFAEADREISEARKALGTTVCSECGNLKSSDKHSQLDSLSAELRQELMQNKYKKSEKYRLKQDLGVMKKRENIYAGLIDKQQKDAESAQGSLNIYTHALGITNQDLADTELLLETVNELRGITIKNCIQNLENKTNQLLTDYYDAEIKVLFAAGDADKIDVTILKDGNTCSYSQLSKGQRQLLKLTFGVSVMRAVANQHGVSFNVAFIDEALEGLDENMKLKTFGLLQNLALEFESLFVVDHSEALKSAFDVRYSVQLINGSSVIEKS